MADHITKQAIDRVVALIAGGATAAGARVYAGRVTPIPVEDLPAVKVMGGDEELEIGTIHAPPQLTRRASIDIECHVAAADGYDAAAYTLLMQIEHLIAGDSTLNGIALDIVPTAVTWEREPDAEQFVVRATLRCVAELVVSQSAVDTPLT